MIHVTCISRCGRSRVDLSTVERVGPSNIDRSGVGRVIAWRGNSLSHQTRKNRLPREEQPGFGTVKAVIASGAATVRASTLPTPSQELAARA